MHIVISKVAIKVHQKVISLKVTAKLKYSSEKNLFQRQEMSCMWIKAK